MISDKNEKVSNFNFNGDYPAFERIFYILISIFYIVRLYIGLKKAFLILYGYFCIYIV